MQPQKFWTFGDDVWMRSVWTISRVVKQPGFTITGEGMAGKLSVGSRSSTFWHYLPHLEAEPMATTLSTFAKKSVFGCI